MPYVFVGKPAIFKGKSLFHLLANLKNFGVGRIVYRTTDYIDYPEGPNFYRILHAQPLMDPETRLGNVVVEKVSNGLRRREPVVISDQVHKTDFRLVPKDEEETFCKWDKVVDYDPELHAPRRPKHMSMPPLMRRVIERSRRQRGEKIAEDSFLLPAHKVYEGDVVLQDRTEPYMLSRLIGEEFSTHKDFSPEEVPEEWLLERFTSVVGVRKHNGYVESYGWEQTVARDEAEREFLKQGQQKSQEQLDQVEKGNS